MSADSPLPSHALVPHPASPPSPVREIRVRVERDGSCLLLDYLLTGEIGDCCCPRHAIQAPRTSCGGTPASRRSWVARRVPNTSSTTSRPRRHGRPTTSARTELTCARTGSGLRRSLESKPASTLSG